MSSVRLMMADGGKSGVWKEKRARSFDFFLVDVNGGGEAFDRAGRTYKRSVMRSSDVASVIRSRVGRIFGDVW